jgi:hypothetical protein
VLVVGAAVFAVTAGPLTAVRLIAAAAFMGGGIASMHYIGMAALHASAHMEHQPLLVVASVLVGMAASGLALWLASGRRRGQPPLLLSAVALGIAIAGMHYTAMSGLTVFPTTPPSSAPALSTDLLAIVVAIVAFVVSGIFLLSLMPDRLTAPQLATAGRSSVSTVPAIESASEPPQHTAAERHAADDAAADDAFDMPAASTAPRRIARRLPVERDGTTQFVAVDDIVAVHANAHYTYIYDGKNKLFCSLAIGDVESRLDNNRFIRVHRSHIVNLDRIVGLKRAGDHSLIELAAEDSYTVPVSRSRFGWLKSRLGLTV